MKGYFIVLLFVSFVLPSCSTLDIPTTEESLQTIHRISPQLAFTDKAIDVISMMLPSAVHITVNLKQAALNRFIKGITENRTDDLHVLLHKTSPLVSETKTILGLPYSNYIDLDSGFMTINVKEMRFTRFSGTRVDAVFALEGKGRIRASGRYMGIPGRTSPELELSLNDVVSFDLGLVEGNLQLRPVQKTVVLKTRMLVTLLEWKIPWSEEIDLQVADIVPAFTLPSTLRGSIQLPVPASTPGEKSVEYHERRIELFQTTVIFDDDALSLRTNFDIRNENGQRK